MPVKGMDSSVKQHSRLQLLSSLCKREALAEGIGTFTLVFAGTGAVMVNTISDGIGTINWCIIGFSITFY